MWPGLIFGIVLGILAGLTGGPGWAVFAACLFLGFLTGLVIGLLTLGVTLVVNWLEPT